jgi:hypothetical protein
VRLEESQQQHVHECRLCQSVLHIFLSLHRDILLTAPKKQTPAA